jgi:uncharacterized protein (TIGR02147 family)
VSTSQLETNQFAHSNQWLVWRKSYWATSALPEAKRGAKLIEETGTKMNAAKSTTEKSTPTVFEYHDYRDFLRDHFAYLKVKDPRMSIREVGRLARISASYINMVLSRKRNLSRNHYNKICRILNLSGSEESFLALLMIFNDSPSMSERQSAFDQIQNYIRYRRMNSKEFEVHKYLSHWYFVAIREMASDSDFRPDPEWIQKRLLFSVSLREIRDALNFLFANGFLEHQNGKVVPLNRRIECMGGVYKLSLNEYYGQMAQISREAFDKIPKEQRNFLSHTIAIPEGKISNLLSVLDKCLNEIVQLTKEAEGHDAVYHFSLQAFPLAQLRKPKSDGEAA